MEQSEAGFDGGEALSAAESEFLARAAAREEADFTGRGAEPVAIRGVVVRRAMLAGMGGSVRLRGAAVAGALDLTGCSGPGGTALPGLEATDCVFEDEIDFSFARIGRLALTRTRIGRIVGRHGTIVSELVLSGVRPVRAAGWVDMPSIEIGGNVDVANTILRAPEARDEVTIEASTRHFALNLGNGRIGGTVFVRDSALRGGLSLMNGRLKSDCWISRSVLRAGEGDALNAQHCETGGGVFFRRSVILGCIWLMRMRIGSSLELTDTRLRPRAGSEEFAVTAHGMVVKGDFLLQGGTRVGGIVGLDGSSTGGRLALWSSRFQSTEPGRITGLSAGSSSVGGDIDINDLRVVGAMSFRDARVAGGLTLKKSDIGLSPEALDKAPETFAQAPAVVLLDFENASFGRSVTIASETVLDRVRVFGEVNFRNAQVGGDFECLSARFDNRSRRGLGIGLNMAGVRIKGTLTMRGVWIYGRFPLEGAQIDGDLTLRRAFVHNGSFPAVLATRAIIKGSVDILICGLHGDVMFSHSRVEGAFTWNFLDVTAGRGAVPHLDMSWMRIGSALSVRALNPGLNNEIMIDLAGLRAQVLVDMGDGWGVASRLNLHGLSFERSYLPQRIEPATRSWRQWLRHGWDGLTDADRATVAGHRSWLDRQTVSPTADGSVRVFDRQAYRQVVKALRAQGEDAAARRIMILERWRAPQTGWLRRAGRWSFGHGFGFGFSVRQAALTLVVTLVFGVCLVEGAARSRMLVSTESVGVAAAAEPAPEVKCGQRIVSVLYAADEMLPVVQLHQESRCRIASTPRVSSVGWQLVFAGFLIVGKIVTSLSFLTFSGVLKRSE